jgi:hypothetical protein
MLIIIENLRYIIHAEVRYGLALPIRTDGRRYQRFVMLIFDSVDNVNVVYEDVLDIVGSVP